MNTKNYIQMTSLIAATLLTAPALANTSIYDNSATALNINMLTDTFIYYANRGQTLSDFFTNKRLYSTMRRVDEYGDDGSTLKTDYQDDTTDSNPLFHDVWIDAQHINEQAHYNHAGSKRARFNLVTLGTDTKSAELKYGSIYFGAFAGYINSDVAHVDSDGAVGGVFLHYDLRNLDTAFIANIGSLNSNTGDTDFNNSWTNFALDVKAKFNLDKTLLIQPGVSLAYTFVSSDDLYVNNETVWSKDYNFFNVSPSVKFIKEIVPNWYGALSAKYVAHFGGDNDIHIGNIKHNGIDTDNYTDIGIDAEYDFKQYVFTGQVHKQIGGYDGWSGGVNVKYIF